MASSRRARRDGPLAYDPATRALERLIPCLALLSLLFGAWYAAGALQVS